MRFQYSLCRVVLMVECDSHAPRNGPTLSVLALSSRFDGLFSLSIRRVSEQVFQYSLCRVVLMVPASTADDQASFGFQYSLCRVVLMVEATPPSRAEFESFSTRSVESF